MPSSMIHLMTAKKVHPDSPVLFYIGNVAPDAAYGREFKDKTHFRDIQDRESALLKLADKIQNDFEEGVLLHLFLDWKWDSGPMQAFIRNYGNDWFLPYREDIGQVSALLFHRDKWFGEMWEEMMEYDPGEYMLIYKELLCVTESEMAGTDITDFLRRNYKFHTANLGNPTFYMPEFVDEFTDTVAQEYIDWRTG